MTAHSIILTILFTFSSLTGWKEFVNDELHYKIKYPDTWEQSTTETGIIFLSPLANEKDGFRESVSIARRNAPVAAVGFKSLRNSTKKEMADILDLKPGAVLSTQNVTLAKQEAVEIVYNMVHKKTKIRTKQYMFLKDDFVYVVTFVAEPSKFNQYESIATEVMQSLEFF